MEIITPVPNKWFIYRNESLPPKLTESGIIRDVIPPQDFV